MNSLLSLGSPEAVSSPRKVEYIHSCACIPYIADAYYGGVLTVYVSHASVSLFSKLEWIFIVILLCMCMMDVLNIWLMYWTV